MGEQHTLYYSPLCPDCQPFMDELDKQGITYNAINITESIKNLKQFMRLRDERMEFDNQRKWGFVGIPALHTKDNTFIFDLNDLIGTTCAPTSFTK